MLIGEVAARTGVSARMLRHYDRIGLVQPSERTSGGYREYVDADVRRLFHVEALRSLGLGLPDVGRVLADPRFEPSTMVKQLITGARERIEREQELLSRLEQVQASEPGAWSDVLRTIALMRGLQAPSTSTRQRTALSAVADSDVTVLIGAMLGEPDPNVAGALQWAVARHGGAAVPLLQEALADGDPQHRRRAAEALIKIPGGDAVLAEVSDHEDQFVRARAALALGRAGSADAVGGLVALVVEGHDDVEAADLLGELAHHGHADRVTETIASALADAHADARSRLTQALADVPGPAADALLNRLGHDQDHQVAHTASYLLTRRKPPSR